MSKLMKIGFMLLLIGLLTACGTNNNDDQAKDNGANNVTEDTNTDTVDEGTDGEISENDANEGNDMNGTEGHVEVADEVANKITELEEVESASVIVTDNNAYVAVKLSEGMEETEELKTKIADAVKAENTDFHNVYVSANPDFTKQFNDYGEKIRAGEPVEGFFDEFTDTVNRVFPNAS